MKLGSGARISLVGCGKMGEAILKGWIASDSDPACMLSNGNFTVVEPSAGRREVLARKYGVSTVGDVREAACADIIVVAVKPQVIAGVLEALADALSESKPPLVISIAAGIATEDIEGILGAKARVVRVMPNLPLQVGQGATVVSGGRSAEMGDEELTSSLFAALGTSHIVKEPQIDAVCAISGGGPAYVAYMVESLRDAGVSCGLSLELAEDLALQTVGGTFSTIAAAHMSPEEMREAVCSPGGTTLAAIGALDEAGFKPMFEKAVKAAIGRAEELRKKVG